MGLSFKTRFLLATQGKYEEAIRAQSDPAKPGVIEDFSRVYEFARH